MLLFTCLEKNLQMASSMKEEILEAKNRLLSLENEVKDLERQLHEKTEWTKQSLDCNLNCSKVWQEFDALMEKARLKAKELCNMRRNMSEQQRKWRLSLQEKEKLFGEVSMAVKSFTTQN